MTPTAPCPSPTCPGSYANGYDVMIAKRICEAYGWELEIVSSAWDGLTPAVQSGTMDANIAGQSMTAARMAEVDMAGPYYYATIVCVTTKDSEYATAQSIADLAGGTCTAQSGTIWYDSCLPQIENAEHPGSRRDRPCHDHGSCRPAPWTSSAPTCPPPWAPSPRTTTW